MVRPFLWVATWLSGPALAHAAERFEVEWQYRLTMETMDVVEMLGSLSQAELRRAIAEARLAASESLELEELGRRVSSVGQEFDERYHPARGLERDNLGSAAMGARLTEVRGTLLAWAELLRERVPLMSALALPASPFLAPKEGDEEVFARSLVGGGSPSDEDELGKAWAALRARLRSGHREASKLERRHRKSLDGAVGATARALKAACDVLEQRLTGRGAAGSWRERLLEPTATAASTPGGGPDVFAALHDLDCVQAAYVGSLRSFGRQRRKRGSADL